MNRTKVAALLLSSLGSVAFAGACSSSSQTNAGNGGAAPTGNAAQGGTSAASGGSPQGTAGANTVTGGSSAGGTSNGGTASNSHGGSVAAGGNVASGGSSTGGNVNVGGDGNPGAGGTNVTGDGGTPTSSTPCDQIPGLVAAYKAAHPGNGGKDWDINAKTPAQLAADPDAQQLLALCGPDQRPVIPEIAWEYGGADHQWISPQASAAVYCVYIPVAPATEHWSYDAQADHVQADVYVLCPDQNPCKAEQGANQVMSCLGDPTNIEILVDTASLNDGQDVGLDVSNASSDLYLILPDSTKVHLYTGL